MYVLLLCLAHVSAAEYGVGISGKMIGFTRAGLLQNESLGRQLMNGDATHYNKGQMGTPPCTESWGSVGGMCIAPGDMSVIWTSGGGTPCDKPKPPCDKPNSYSCNHGKGCPKCPGTPCGVRVKICCDHTNPIAKKFCKKECVVAQVTNACPHNHGCNMYHKVCGASDPNHIDICDTAFDVIATSNPKNPGLPITFEIVGRGTKLGPTSAGPSPGPSPPGPSPGPSPKPSPKPSPRPSPGPSPGPTCADVKPPGSMFGCGMQKTFKKCGKSWMKGHCCKTCFNCKNCGSPAPGPAPTPAPKPKPGPSPKPSPKPSPGPTCQDVKPPSSTFGCGMQKTFKKCGASWMKGYCCKTCFGCHNCGTPSPRPAPRPSPGPSPRPSPRPSPSPQCADVKPSGSKYSCAQQKTFKKCGASWMKGHCCKTCFNCRNCNGQSGDADDVEDVLLSERSSQNDEGSIQDSSAGDKSVFV